MSKFNSGKASLVAIFFSVLLGAFFLGKTVTKVVADSGSIWTTTGSCGDPQNVNHYVIGAHVYINGSNFNSGNYDWDIKSTGSGSTTVASGHNYHVGSNGSFCFDAHTIQSNENGEYRATFGGKHDNYRIEDTDLCANISGTQTQVPTGYHQVSNNCYLIAGTCPTACGQTSSQVPDGNGGNTNCPATNPCPINCSSHYGECSVNCGVGTRPLIIDIPASNGGVACPTAQTISCELPACIDNRTPVCTDEIANNYDSHVDENEYSDNKVCTYSTRRWCSLDETESGFRAVAVPVNEYPPKTGKPWVTGMDKYCVVNQVEPTPNPDLCANIEGIQYSVPEGLHLDAGNINCVSFDQAGPPVRNDENGGTPTVLGTSTVRGGQVLGTSTMAKTGGFAENLYMAIMGLGGILSTVGIKNFKKASKKA